VKNLHFKRARHDVQIRLVDSSQNAEMPAVMLFGLRPLRISNAQSFGSAKA
jgi:hypothetical protein